MLLNDALAQWYSRTHPVWQRRWGGLLLLAGFLLLAALLIAYVNIGEILAPAAGGRNPLLEALAGLKGSQGARVFQWLSEICGVLLLAVALQERRRQISPPRDLRTALSLADYRSYARSCLDRVEQALLFWSLPLSSLLVYTIAWLQHFSTGGFGLGRIALPLLGLLCFKTFLVLLILLLLLRGEAPLLLGLWIAVVYAARGLLSWTVWLLGAEGLFDLGLRLPSAYLEAFVEIGLTVAAIAILLPLLTRQRDKLQAAYGKLD